MNKEQNKKQEEIIQEKGTEKDTDRQEKQKEEIKDKKEETQTKTKNKKTKKPAKQDEKIKELNEKIKELNDKHLRLYSEFDNFRKRTLKEKTELIKTSTEDIIVELLPVLDDFERACRSFDEADNNNNSLKEGIKLILNKFQTVLKSKGLEEIDSDGKDFDTDYHEAVTQVPAPSEDMKGKVVETIEKGYILNGKVIRYSKVVVGK